MERYFLKMTNGFFEEVDKYTFDNSKFALADDGTPRYIMNSWVIVKDGTISLQLQDSPLQDVAILQRVLNVTAPAEIKPHGLVREPEVIKFLRGKYLCLRYLKEGKNYKEVA